MQPIQSSAHFKWPRSTIGDLDAETAARVMAASSDVAMVIDREGIIRDVAVANSDLSLDGFADIVERRWIDTVTPESRRKVEEMLHDAAGKKDVRWREVNHQSARDFSQAYAFSKKFFNAFAFVFSHDVHPFLRSFCGAARLTSAVTSSPQGWVVFRCRLLGGFARRAG